VRSKAHHRVDCNVNRTWGAVPLEWTKQEGHGRCFGTRPTRGGGDRREEDGPSGGGKGGDGKKSVWGRGAGMDSFRGRAPLQIPKKMKNLGQEFAGGAKAIVLVHWGGLVGV